jgi:hypothetical protein
MLLLYTHVFATTLIIIFQNSLVYMETHGQKIEQRAQVMHHHLILPPYSLETHIFTLYTNH